MKNIDLVYFNAGGGHRAAALALQAVVQQQQRPWNLRLLNLVDVLDPARRFHRLTGLAPEDFYNKRLNHGWTLGLAQELKLLQAMIRLGHTALQRPLQQHWLGTEPDLVVSLVPNFNRALYGSLASTLPGVPFVTLLTDLADHPPHFWIEPGQDQHLICGSPRAVDQARAAGYGPDRVSLTSGMVLNPSFYEPDDGDRAEALRAFGMDPTRPVGVVLFGGQGSTQMISIARALHDVQLILMCGRNEELAQRLGTLRPAAAHRIVGFTQEVGRHLRLADFFIGKPGPGSLSEAVQCGLPILTYENAWTLPQERYNAQWVRDAGLGLVLPSMRATRAGSVELLGRLAEFRARVQTVHNRAVFEVPEILAGLLQASTVPAQPSAWQAGADLAQST